MRNLTRLSRAVRFVLDAWPEPRGLFPWLQGLGGLSVREMFGTFNMGIGFLVVVRPKSEARVREALARAGAPDAIPVGHVERGRGVEVPAHGLTFRDYA